VKNVVGDFEQLFERGLYREAIAMASASAPQTPRQTAVVGISLLRLGDAVSAETPLYTAMVLGDMEAVVEYGNLLRALGRFREADDFLTNTLNQVDGELKIRATRWLGLVQYQNGKTKEGIKNLEKSRRDYESRGLFFSAAKVKQTLFVVYSDIGELKKAGRMLEEAILEFRRSSETNLLITGLRNSIALLAALNRTEEIPPRLIEIEHLLGEEVSSQHINYWAAKVMLYDKGIIDKKEYESLLTQIIDASEIFGDHENLIWGIVKKVEFLLEFNRTSDAMRLVYQAPQDENGLFPYPVRIVRAMINRRMGNLHEAIEELTAVAQDLEDAENVAELARVRLQLAYALHLDGKSESSADVLRAALQGLLRTNIHPSMRPELEEMSELLHFAAMEPSLAPYLEPVMDSLAGVLGGEGGSDEQERVRLQVYTLGQVSILKNGDPVVFQLKGTVPLLVYLALTPNRTIHEILADLYPEKEPTAGSSYVRKSIQELRMLLGNNAVLTEGPRNHSRYRLGPSLQIDLDLARFNGAVDQSEMPRALALYRGEFLPGSDESEWVLQKREAARLSLSFELHNQMVGHREKHEWRRVILLANQFLRVDPYDMEVHEMRVDAARRVGTAAELGRFVAAMNSPLN
jgi:DNA-binding SARP family transcriptional activator